MLNSEGQTALQQTVIGMLDTEHKQQAEENSGSKLR